ncbi:DUF6173 family protein [Clostridium thermarum]|uniref:DUF6173 family protein n=1 Tax=Clostridium thermarum TaxID=1716543 RepID=UPI0011221A8E|nr:DUF6173 family protein [Clostridium thermarum]
MLDFLDAVSIKDSIVNSIKMFESKLSDDLEVAIIINSLTIRPTAIAANTEKPLIYFSGTYSGATIQIIQHINQINFALIAVAKENPNQTAKRIGFTLG